MPSAQQKTNLSEETPSSKLFYLIKGDVSGIQRFIFNVKSSGAAQSLKGRSFFIKILLEVGMQMVFDAYGIEDKADQKTAKISTSGGNFILRLEVDDISKIDALQLRLSKALRYTGLNMMLSGVPEEEYYPDTLSKLNNKIRERKYELLIDEHSLFEPFEHASIISISDNNKWKKVTDQLKQTSHFLISIQQESPPSQELTIGGDKIFFAGYQITFGDKGIPLKRYLESLFPKSKKGPVTFENLAKFGGGQGIQKLGVLAMDVDNLGNALEQLPSLEKHKAFDSKIQAFFNTQLWKILQKSEFENKVYVVTAGGDDSFFVGKWNTLLKLATTINKDFLKEFSDHQLTISAALVIVDPNFPVVRFAQMAEHALSDAKYKYEGLKGNLNLFGEVLDWKVFNKEISDLRDTFNKKRKDLITSGLLTKARITSLKIAKDKGLRLSDFWKMGYYMRDFGNQGSKILSDFRHYLNHSLKENNPVKKRSYRLIFPIAARLAEFDKRKN